jgi:DNA polymerase I-like protein with 3'-5' exonuclease and polymerase domains
VIALDTETTGISLYHGARPFFVTTCDDHGEQTWWEWDVDPLTREVCVPARDLEEVRGVILDAPELVLQNVKFDATALGAILLGLEWPWARTQDTLMAGHLLASNLPHALDDMALQYLGVDIRRYEETLKAAVQKARRLVQQAKLKARRGKGEGELASWQIAAEGTPGMPGVKKSSNKRDDKAWKNDCWLPRALCLWAQQRALQPAEPELAVTAPLLGVRRKRKPPPRPWWADYADPTHPWLTVLRDYANTDSAVTLALWQVQEQEIKRRCLWAIYRRRMEVLPVAHHMEARGITYSKPRQQELRQQYVQESAEAGAICVNIAASYGHKLELPRNGVNKSLREFMFQYLHLEPLRGPKAKTEAPTLNAAAMEYYRQTLPPRGKALAFIRALTGKRQRDTAITYLDGYTRFALPWGDGRDPDWWLLHPSLNPTGTDTLRWSSAQPNEQNISKKEGFNLRYIFGPAPGREWWSLDAKNIELRIPAYESGEEAFIALFERPDDPPYFGSNHLLISHILHPKEFESCVDEKGQVDGRLFKKKYASTLYQWVKNGNFAVQYGAVDKEDGTGTADRAYHMKGAQARIKARFTKQDGLNQYWIDFAERNGYVETMPDRSVDPKRGYPVLCSRTEFGRIKPTVPLNYHVQSTAMWWMMQSMVRCESLLSSWRQDGFDAWMVMQVHDELVFDFPKSRTHSTLDNGKFRLSNLWRVRAIQRLMEQGGGDINVPTPVSIEYHEVSWAEGVTL